MDGSATIASGLIESAARMGCGNVFDGPSGPSPFAVSTVTHIESHDADELAEALLDWRIELLQLRPGAFDGELTLIPLGPALICTGRFSPSMLERVSTPDDCVAICRPGRGSDPVSLAGHVIEDSEVFVNGSCSEGETISYGLRLPMTLSVHVDYLRSQSDWLGSTASLPEAGSVKIHAPGREWTSDFLDAIEWVVDATTHYRDTVMRPNVCGSLLDTLLFRTNLLHATEAPSRLDREARAARRGAVERAREYIAANLTDPIRLSHLCKYARTQARSLEYGFREAVGLSPIAYIRATRLHRVRRLLHSTAVRTRSISEIALDCGFWHLSQFAVDYKQLFAESPSVTYRRTQTQLPSVEPRRRSAAIEPVASRTACVDSVRIPIAS